MKSQETSLRRNRGLFGCARLIPFGLLLAASISSGEEAGKAGSSEGTLGAEREPTAELRLVSAQPLGIESAIEEALRANPELQAARRSVQAAEQRIRPAGALADPEIELNLSDFGMDGGARRSELMVRQMFDWPGKRPLMREEMRAMAGMSAQEAAEMGLEVAARVREAYWELHRVRQNLALSDKTLQILRDFVQISESRYAAGAGIQQDVLRAQAEVYKLEARLAEFRQEERSTLAGLNVLLGRPASESIEIELDGPMVPPLPANPDSLTEEALAQRPALRALELELHRQEVRASIAKKDSWPDLEVEAGVMHVSSGEVPIAEGPVGGEPEMTEMPSDVAFSIGLMASIPLWKDSKQAPRVAEAREEREAAAARLEAARLAVGLDVQTLSERCTRIRKQIQTYDEEVLPRDRQAVASALESYQVGAADFLTLLSSQITTLDDQIELHRLHSLYNKALARLDRAVGRNPIDGQTGRAARVATSDASGTPPSKEPRKSDVQ